MSKPAEFAPGTAGAPAAAIILGYIGFVYYLFRGKVREGEGYH